MMKLNNKKVVALLFCMLMPIYLYSCTTNSKNIEGIDDLLSAEINVTEINMNTTDQVKTENDCEIENNENKLDEIGNEDVRSYEYFRVLSNTLNVREHPSEDSNIISQVEENYVFYTVDTFTDDQGRVWYQENETKGWLASSYCKKIILYPSEGNERYYTIRISAESAIQKDPEYTSEVLENVLPGEYFRILETYIDDKSNSYWYRVVSKNGHHGWIEGTYCTEQSSDYGKRIAFIDEIKTISKNYQDHNETFFNDEFISNLSDSINNVKQLFTFEDMNYVIIGFSIEDTVYTYSYNKKEQIIRFVGSSDYMIVNSIYCNQFLELEYSNGIESGIKIVDLISERKFEDYLTVHYKQSKLLEDKKVLLIEVIEQNNESDNLINGLRSLYYYDLELGEQIPFKVARKDMEWTFTVNDKMMTIYKVPIENGIADKMIVYLQEEFEYWPFPIELHQPYLTAKEIDQHLNKPLASYSDEDIKSHVEKLEDVVIFTSVIYDEKLFFNENHVDKTADEFLYFHINFYNDYYSEYFSGIAYEQYLLKWKRNSNEYEFIQKIDFNEYFSNLNTKGTREEIVEYVKKCRLYTTDKCYFTMHEFDNQYVFELIDYAFDVGSDYYKLMIVEKDGKCIFTDQSFNKLLEIIDDKLIITYENFIESELQIHNLSLLEQDQEFVLYLQMNKYNRLDGTNWLIIETTHPYPDGWWSKPDITDIEFMNIETNEVIPYRVHDLKNDYLYFLNEENNTIEIYMKNIGEEKYDSDPIEVIELSSVQTFLERLMKDIN